MASTKKEKDIIDQIVNLLKEHHLVKELFRKFHIELDFIDKIPIEFKDLDVSAKAKNGRVYINSTFLEDGDIIDNLHYFFHEITHVLQQITGQTGHATYDKDHYLDDPAEVEAFKNQIKFIDSYKSPKEADKYVDDLLDFHELEGEDRKAKRKQLRGE